MSIDLSKIEKLYSDNLKEHGIDPKSVGWGTYEKQSLRFEKLLKIVEEPAQGFSVSELGCGYGELVNYCCKNNYNLLDYHGYDISSEMLVSAQGYIKKQGTNFYNGATIAIKSDYTIASGIFNVRFENNTDQWIEYIQKTIENLYEYASMGVAFNMLTKYVDFEAENLFYGDPLFFFDYCKKRISKKITLLHDYDLYEWTLLIKK